VTRACSGLGRHATPRSGLERSTDLRPACRRSTLAMPPVRACASSDGTPLAAPNLDASAGVHATYVRILTWAFTFFNSVRVIAYLPTLWTLAHSDDSSQHSLWTWATWFFANLTMALWQVERNGSRLDRVAIVGLANSAMCFAVLVLLVVLRC
jgi:hypothetical protein